MPRASSRQPIEAAARPLPSDDTTPPVTKMYFADMSATSLYIFEICAGWARLSIAGSEAGGNGRDFQRLLISRDSRMGAGYPCFGARKDDVHAWPCSSAVLKDSAQRRVWQPLHWERCGTYFRMEREGE